MPSSDELQSPNPSSRKRRELSLTERQNQFLQTITRLTKESQGIPPSMEEIARAYGCAKSTAQTLVARLRKRGYVEPSTGKYRNIKVAGWVNR
jgi:DNA-binding MarR family transcriptional regulator